MTIIWFHSLAAIEISKSIWDQLQTIQEYTTSLMLTSGIGTFCLKPITFSLNIIKKYSLQNKISTTTLRPLIAILSSAKEALD